MGNLEFDHADIFRNLDDIQIQFHHLTRIIPASGCIIAPQDDRNLAAVFARGVWSEISYFGTSQGDWRVRPVQPDGSAFQIQHGAETGEVAWSLLGQHNMNNAVAATAAAAHTGVPLAVSCEALSRFRGVKRRLELLGKVGGISVYDDFAHHPTAIKTTLDGLRLAIQSSGSKGRLIALIEARSNTMKQGYHQDTLAGSMQSADSVLWYRHAAAKLDLDAIALACTCEFTAMDDTNGMINWVLANAKAGDHVVIMSNGGFEGIHQRLLQALEQTAGSPT